MPSGILMTNYGPLAVFYATGTVVQCRTCMHATARADGTMDCLEQPGPVERLDRCWDYRREPGADDDVPAYFPFGRDRALSPPQG